LLNQADRLNSSWAIQFCAKLVVTNQDIITDRYKKITQRLNTDFWNAISDTAHSLYIGSYGRNTRIAGSSDVDMLVELPGSIYTKYNDYQGNGQSALLQAVRKSIATSGHVLPVVFVISGCILCDFL
jgi:tRNA nucleotidyltransferase (CCA-adding enzyme)